ncbi:cupin domain-containing protein [Oceanibacterium hippocampi]|uniref:ChrR Cupin-like domain protein n=1 Tax=Oceanibacterium hippocampi TaxID=745714 RepID=A0A1Y5TZ85_9PROT|nr:cupin domain-containing protein [Oceanibacterium hippocampi]SLN77058.1 ChrR Cupin-like domain protein [Oceanibacterium hippocampi]
MSHELNADFHARVAMDTAAMAWQASPSPSVWRKRLDLSGPAEAGRVTALVRYEPGSRFPAHEHPDGEEILVLEGTFSDEHGDYPAGSYLLNPEGFRHAPFSVDGCLLFVKLRQFGGPGRAHHAIDTAALDWQPGNMPGRSVKPLYAAPDGIEQMRLVRLDPGAQVPRHVHDRGEEVLVLEGAIADEDGTYGKGSWLRFPDGSAHSVRSEHGAVIYVKQGHLPPAS